MKIPKKGKGRRVAELFERPEPQDFHPFNSMDGKFTGTYLLFPFNSIRTKANVKLFDPVFRKQMKVISTY